MCRHLKNTITFVSIYTSGGSANKIYSINKRAEIKFKICLTKLMLSKEGFNTTKKL